MRQCSQMSGIINLLISKMLAGICLLGRVLRTLLLWFVIVVILEFIIVANVSLDSQFTMMAIIGAPLTAIIIMVVISKAAIPQPRFTLKWKNLSRRKEAGLVLLLLLILIGVVAGEFITSEIARSKDAELALQSFKPIYSNESNLARVEQTLAEFERARRRLADLWAVPDSSERISLRLFQDIQDFAMKTGREGTRGVVFCLPEGVLIEVPLEEVPILSDESLWRNTPLHEMVHAIWCQNLGYVSYRSIPRWFHEGMAQWHEMEGRRQLLPKAFMRLWVWINNEDLLSVSEFCGYTFSENREIRNLLYGTSFEFIRSLEVRHGIEELNAIVDDVGAGKDFDASMRDRLGGTCTDLYSDWSHNIRNP